MTTKVADDATLGKIARQYHDLFRRVREGTLDPEKVSKGLQVLIETAASILRLLRDTVSIPTQKKFAASDHFILRGALNIGWMSGQFKSWFLGKVEEPRAESRLSSWELTKNSLDKPILEELGEKAETALAHIAHLLSLQSKGEAGVLLTNGANVFYIPDAGGTLRAVYVFWSAYCRAWDVRAFEVAYPSGWSAGYRVFSRNS